MPLVFRRSKRLAPGLRLNVGRRGGSLSLGGRGAGMTVGRRGVSQRVSLPGTGLSYRRKAHGCGLLLLVPLLVGGLGLGCASSAKPAATRAPARIATIQPTTTASVLTSPAPTRLAGTTAAKNANLRAGPGTTFAVRGGVQAGAPLEISGRNAAGDWYQLASGAWIAAFLVTGAPAGLPVVEAGAAAPAARSHADPPSADASNCACDRGDALNCDDFDRGGWDAQACYLRCKELAGGDVHRLDRDGDGAACEWRK